MNRIEVNVITGECKFVELTPDEVADAIARTAAESAQPPRKKLKNGDLAAVLVAKGVITQEEVDAASR